MPQTRSQQTTIDLTKDPPTKKKIRRPATQSRLTRKQAKDDVWRHVQIVPPPQPQHIAQLIPDVAPQTQPARARRTPNRVYDKNKTYGPDIYKCPYCYAPNFYKLDACNSLKCVNCGKKFCVKCGKGFKDGEAFHARCGIFS